MNERDLRALEIISEIDEDIIEEKTIERANLLAKYARRRRRRAIMAASALAASLVIVFSATLTVLMQNSPSDEPGGGIIQGPTMREIVFIEYSKTVGNVDVYTVNYSDGSTSEFAVSNVRGEENASNVASLRVNDSGEIVATLNSGKELNIGNNISGAVDASDSSAIIGLTARSGGGLELNLKGDKDVYLKDTKLTCAKINESGELILGFGKDGAEINLGRVVGKDGEDGVGIASIEVSEAGELIVTLTNGTVLNLGNIKGKDGIGISESKINDEGELCLTYTDGKTVNLGRVVGKDGEDGVGIASMTINEEGELTVTLTNGTVLDLGNIRGKDGIGISESKINDEGELCLTYTDGKTVNLGKVVGKDGVGVSNIEINESGELNITLTDGTVIELGNIRGEDGKSAYELYCEKYGYEGTEEEWLFDLANGLLAEKISYTVSFDTGCDFNVPSQSIESGNKAQDPGVPERAGYTFNGWCTESGEPWVFAGFSITGDTVIYADWKIITYSIVYENEDDPGTYKRKYNVNDTFVLPEPPSRNGYEFLGWICNGVGEPDPEYTVRRGTVGNLSFRTVWEANEYKISYELDGGAISGENPSRYNVETESFTLKNPTKFGYTFLGWTRTGSTVPKETVTVEKGSVGDLRFVAKWKINEYGIEYLGLSAKTTNNNPTGYDVTTEDITLSPPVRDNCEFLGWTWDGQSEPVTSVVIPAGSIGDRRYTAHWAATETFAINYTLYGGSNPTKNPTSYTALDSFVLLSAEKNGYNFVGWYDENGDPVSYIDVDSEGDIQLFARFAPKEYKINYVLFGGVNSDANPSTYTIEDYVSFFDPERKGYTFVGWFSDANFEDEITELSGGNTGDKTIYANWKLTDYTLTFDAAGGEMPAEYRESYNFTENVPLPTPTKDNYAFVGWKKQGDDSEKIYLEVDAGTAENITFIAVYNCDFLYTDYEDGLMITGYRGSKTSLEIPATIDGKSVTVIGASAFSQNRFIENLVIPSSIKLIEWGAFYGSALKTVDFGNSFCTVGDRSFFGSSLKSISNALNVTEIGDQAFFETQITSVEFGDSLKEIGLSAFCRCTSLESVKFGNGLEKIRGAAFYECASLTEIIIPKSCTLIETGAFAGCDSLNDVTFEKCGTLKLDMGIFYSAQHPEKIHQLDRVTVLSGVVNRIYGENYATIRELVLADGVTDFSTSSMNFDILRLGDGITTLHYLSASSRVGKLYLGKNVSIIESGAFAHLEIGEIHFSDITEWCSWTEYPTEREKMKFFIGDEEIVDLVIPEGVTSISNGAFLSWYSLESVTIPSSLTKIGNGAFAYCYNLNSVLVSDVNSFAMISFGNATSNPLNCADVLIENGDVVTELELSLANGVSKISAYAFAGFKSLEKLTIDGVSMVEANAFTGCSSLTEVTILGKDISFNGNAFDNLSRVNITSLDDWCSYVFANESANPLFSGIPRSNSLVKKGADLVLNGTVITDLSFGTDSSVTAIKDYAFSGCRSIESIDLTGGKVTEIGKYAFGACGSLKQVIIGEKTKTLGTYSFYSCPSLLDVKLGTKTTSIGSNAFYDCTSLATVEAKDSSLAEILSGAFRNCTALSEITLPETLYGIAENAFSNCTKLRSIYLPAAIATVVKTAFSDCVNLAEIYNLSSLSITPGYGIAEYALAVYTSKDAASAVFKDENGFIFFDNGSTRALLDYEGDDTELILPESCNGNSYVIWKSFLYNNKNVTDVVVSNGVTRIEDAFFGVNLNSIVIGDNVEYIGIYLTAEKYYVSDVGEWLDIFFASEASPLYGCELYAGGELVVDLVIPDRITEIKKNAFYGYRHLESVTLHSGVSAIGDNAFDSCTRLMRVYNYSSLGIAPGSAGYGMVAYYAIAVYSSYEEDTDFYVDENGFLFFDDGIDVYLMGYRGTETGVSLPESCKGSPYAIYKEAFYGADFLAPDLVIPDAVTEIGESAFAYCDCIRSVTFGSGIKIIGKSAFTYCNGIANLIIPDNVTEIGEQAFTCCRGLESVLIGNGVSSIGNSAFMLCEALEELTIGNKVTKIGDSAFNRCSSLKSVVIPDSVTSIGKLAFYYCINIIDVTLGRGVTTIGTEAFYVCNRLVEVTNRSSLSITKGSHSNGYVGYYAIEVHTGESKIVNEDGFLFYSYNGVNYLIGYVGNEKFLILPDSYNGEKYVIYDYAFYNNYDIVSVVISDSVTEIRAKAFSGCSGLVSITIGRGVTSISSLAFSSSSKLVEVVNNSSLYIQPGTSGNGQVALWAIEVHSGESKLVNENGFLFYSYNGVNYLLRYVGDETSIILPDSYNGEEYVIYQYAFLGEDLVSVVIPDCVSSIGEYAFYGCGALTSVTFENADGWSTDEQVILASELSDPETAATLLTKELYNSSWMRS